MCIDVTRLRPVLVHGDPFDATDVRFEAVGRDLHVIPGVTGRKEFYFLRIVDEAVKYVDDAYAAAVRFRYVAQQDGLAFVHIVIGFRVRRHVAAQFFFHQLAVVFFDLVDGIEWMVLQVQVHFHAGVNGFVLIFFIIVVQPAVLDIMRGRLFAIAVIKCKLCKKMAGLCIDFEGSVHKLGICWWIIILLM